MVAEIVEIVKQKVQHVVLQIAGAWYIIRLSREKRVKA
jgi:hypothetical protein